MANILASTIISATGTILQDPSNVRWSSADLLQYINDGEKVILVLKPDAYMLDTTFVLVAGVRQSIPASGVVFRDSPVNMGTDGTTQGHSIAFIDKDELDIHNPDWPTDDAAASVIRVIYNQDDPKKFYCYPPQPTSGFGYLRWPYAAIPADIAAASNSINLDDIYKEPLIQWCLYKSYSRDSKDAANKALADAAENRFYRLLGFKDKNEAIKGAE